MRGCGETFLEYDKAGCDFKVGLSKMEQKITSSLSRETSRDPPMMPWPPNSPVPDA